MASSSVWLDGRPGLRWPLGAAPQCAWLTLDLYGLQSVVVFPRENVSSLWSRLCYGPRGLFFLHKILIHFMVLAKRKKTCLNKKLSVSNVGL